MPDGNFVDLAAHFRAARLIHPPAYRRDQSIHYGVRSKLHVAKYGDHVVVHAAVDLDAAANRDGRVGDLLVFVNRDGAQERDLGAMTHPLV